MIHKYLKELVENNSRIIIPDFGAFMIQNSPEGQQISFNDFLKFNDGLLVNQIIKAEKVTKNQALDQIKSYVKEIETAFSAGKSFEVQGIGFLKKDDHGNIKFELKAVSQPSATIQTEKPVAPKPTIILDEKKEETKVEKPEVKKEEPIAPKIEEKKEVKEVNTVSQPTVTPPVPPKPPVQQPAKPVTPPPAAKPVQSNVSKSSSVSKTSSSGGSKAVLFIILAAIIVGGGIWAAFHFGYIGKNEAPVAETHLEPAIDSSMMANDTTVIDSIAEEPKVVEETVPESNSGKRYYIVAGSFTVQNNAINFNEKLKGEGYSSEIVDRKNGYYTVTYKTIYNWNDALSEWRQMRSVNEQTWILVKN